jgi:hypothetical protein
MHQLMEQDFVRQRRGVPVRAAAPTSWGEEDHGLRRSRDNADLLGVAVLILMRIRSTGWLDIFVR